MDIHGSIVLRDAYWLGRRSFTDGDKVTSNPFAELPALSEAWHSGWHEARQLFNKD